MATLSLLVLALILPHASATRVSGDEAFLRIDYPGTVALYESALASDTSDPGLLWRLARAYVCMGETEEREQQLLHLQCAETYARRCILVDSAVAEGHTWLAGALGYRALISGTGDQVKLCNRALAELAEALKLNPNDDIAYSIEGSIYRALGNVGWLKRRVAALFIGGIPDGGYEEAEAALRKAVALAPTVMRHHYELGVLYLDWGRRKEAKEILEHAATLPVQTAIDRPRLNKIREYLVQLEDVR